MPDVRLGVGQALAALVDVRGGDVVDGAGGGLRDLPFGVGLAAELERGAEDGESCALGVPRGRAAGSGDG